MSGTQQEKTRLERMLEIPISLGFALFQIVLAGVVVLSSHRRTAVPLSLLALLGVIGCGLLWGKYWLSKRNSRWYMWAMFICAIVFTVIAAWAVMLALVRTL